MRWKTLLLAWCLCTLPAARAAEPFPEAMVSLTFDDGYDSQYTLAAPALAVHSFPATFYLIADPSTMGARGNLSVAEAVALAAQGHEIGSHTISHPHLTAVSDAQLEYELQGSQDWLAAIPGLGSVTSFAYPFGDYDARVLAASAQVYGSSRAVFGPTNWKDANRYELRAIACNADTALASVLAAIDDAVASRAWLVLYLHQLTEGPPPPDLPYGFDVADLRAILAHVAASGAKVVTIREGVALMDPPPPTLASVSPATGPNTGGTRLTLRGAPFDDGVRVTIDGAAAAVESATSSSVSVLAPAHPGGTVDVTVTNGDGRSSTLRGAYTYVPPPDLTSVAPDHGPAAGGARVTIGGSGFVQGAAVTIAGFQAVITSLRSTAIDVTTPPHTPGAVDVTVTNPDGRASTLGSGYVYDVPPLVVAPVHGPVPPRASLRLAASGGSGGYRWQLLAAPSGATLDEAGLYRAGESGDTADRAQVTDSGGGTAQITVAVGPGVTISASGVPAGSAPFAATVEDALAFAAGGGSGTGYTWTVLANRSGASLDPRSGAYVAGRVGGVVDEVQVADDLGNVAAARIAVAERPVVPPDPPPTPPPTPTPPASTPDPTPDPTPSPPAAITGGSGGCSHGGPAITLLLLLPVLAARRSRGARPRGA